MPAAPSIVRMDRAVRPCLPITLPRSLGATFNSSTVTCSPCTSLTETSSGMSTRAFAISSINCFISPRLPQSSWYPKGAMQLTGIVVPRPGTRSVPYSYVDVWCSGHRGCNGGILLHKPMYGVRHLRAFAGPVLHPVMFEDDRSRVAERVVVPDDLKGAAIPGALLLNH